MDDLTNDNSDFIDAAMADISSDLGFDTSADESAADDALPAGGAETSADDVAGEEGGEAAAAETKPAEVTIPEPPKTWRKEATEHWAALPEAARAEILKREEDMFRGLEGYKQLAGLGKSVQEVLTPFEGQLRAQNIDPVGYVGQLLAFDAALAQGSPEQKLDLLLRVGQAYGLDVRAALGVETPYVDPQVAELQKQLSTVQSQLSTQARAQEVAARQKAEATLDAFLAKPEAKYFSEVHPQLLRVLQVEPNLSLEEAYSKACRLNDGVWAKMQLEAQQAADAERQAKAAAHAANARKAVAVNVQSSPRVAKSGTATLADLDDTLAETLASIKNRN